MSNIVIFESGTGPVQVRLEGETLWATQSQIADLFGTSTDNIGLHLKNIYSEGELAESATTEEFSVVRQEGNRQVRRRLKHYNLDAVISVGYRVSSRRATRFRQWATRVLREHLTQGYSLNEHRLAQQGLSELEQAVELLGQTLTRQELVSDLGQEVVGLILGYAHTWRLLQDYDEGALGVPPGARPARGVLGLDEARRALDALAAELRERGEATELFARDRGDGLASILGNLEQSMFGEFLYKTREERAAHLLYFVIKNHPFSDGNKRSGAFLFLLYLRQEGMRLTLNEQGLTALTLLIAESDPKAKDLMVRLVMNLIAEGGTPSQDNSDASQ
ncbi:MAG: RhuM family protein [Methylohalobius crimeensis]